MVSPTSTPPWLAGGETTPLFTIETCGSASTVGIVTVAGSDRGLVPPASPTPAAVAVSVTSPASTSSCVTVCGASAAQVTELPGASPGGAGVGQVTEPMAGSSIATDVKLTLPMLVTR